MGVSGRDARAPAQLSHVAPCRVGTPRTASMSCWVELRGRFSRCGKTMPTACQIGGPYDNSWARATAISIARKNGRIVSRELWGANGEQYFRITGMPLAD